MCLRRTENSEGARIVRRPEGVILSDAKDLLSTV
jgi:hypothetical protein